MPMQPFRQLNSRVIPLRITNVDTDMIIPKQYLKNLTRTGLARGLFEGMRYRKDGSENPGFPLNNPGLRDAKILVAGDNFGCGSSREQAPWGFLEYGIRCIISTSFADIFYNNCFKNGILLVKVSAAELERLFVAAEAPTPAVLQVDLPEQRIVFPDGDAIRFEIDASRKDALIKGLNEIDVTLEQLPRIEAFERLHWQKNPWL